MQIAAKISPCLWYDDQAEAAANFYTSIFPNSRIVRNSYFTDAGRELHGKPPGSLMAVEFEIAGQPFMALNGGPMFKFSEAISFQVSCDSQEEIDYYWDKLSAGGSEGQCGWLKDRFGVSWQVNPTAFSEYISGPDPVKASRALEAMFQMQKIDLAAIKRAYEGG